MLNKKAIGAFVAAVTLLSGFAFASLPPVALASTPSASNVEQADNNNGFSLAKMYGTTDGVGLLYSTKMDHNSWLPLFLYRQMLKDSEAARMQSPTGRLDAASEKLLESVRVELYRKRDFQHQTIGGDYEDMRDFQGAWSAIKSASTPQALKDAYSNVLRVAEKWYRYGNDNPDYSCNGDQHYNACVKDYKDAAKRVNEVVASLKKVNSNSYEDPCVPTLSKNIYSDYAFVKDPKTGEFDFKRVKYAGFATYDEYVASFNCSGNSSAIGGEHHDANPSDDHGVHSDDADDASKKDSSKVPAAPKSVNDLKNEVKNKIVVGNNNVANAGVTNRVVVHVDNESFNNELKQKGSVRAYAFIYSTPKLLHGSDGSDYVTVKAGANGVISFDAKFPDGYSGKHTVVLVDQEGNQLAWTNITVKNNVKKDATTKKDSKHSLPLTGVNVVLTLFVMLMFATAGGLLRKVR